MYGKHWCWVRETLTWYSTAYLFLLASTVLIPHQPSHQQASRILQAFGQQLASSWAAAGYCCQLDVSAAGSQMNQKKLQVPTGSKQQFTTQ